MFRFIPVLVASLLMLPVAALSSPGGLNAEGCHTNRKTGHYHCHRKNHASAKHALGVPKLMKTGASFRNCTEARRAGVGPIRLGAPGYAPHLDRDRDGIACE